MPGMSTSGWNARLQRGRRNWPRERNGFGTAISFPIGVIDVQLSQVQKLKRDFNRGRRHTIFSAMVRLGIGALHQRVKELRDSGYEVKRRLVRKHGRNVAEFSRG